MYIPLLLTPGITFLLPYEYTPNFFSGSLFIILFINLKILTFLNINSPTYFFFNSGKIISTSNGVSNYKRLTSNHTRSEII